MRNFLKFLFFKNRWKQKNHHNKTWPGKVFDISKVSVGRYTYGEISVDTSGNEGESLHIGSFCSIASNVKFVLAGEHNIDFFSTYPFKQKLMGETIVETKTKGEIIVDDDVWIGERALILSGVHIGQGAVVAAGAVVTKNVSPYTIVGGVPANVIGKRFDDSIIEKLLKIDFDSISESLIRTNIDKLYEHIDDKYDFSFLPLKHVE